MKIIKSQRNKNEGQLSTRQSKVLASEAQSEATIMTNSSASPASIIPARRAVVNPLTKPQSRNNLGTHLKQESITTKSDLTPTQLFWGQFYQILHEEADKIRRLQSAAAASSVSEAGNAATVSMPPSETERQTDSTITPKARQTERVR